MNSSQDTTVTDVVAKNETPKQQRTSLHLTPAELAKREDDFDLIGACRQILVDHVIDPEQLANYDASPTLNNAKGLTTAAQRIALNQYWHLQMGPFGRLSHPQRCKLIEDGTTADWLTFFSQGPVQFILDNKLPVSF